MPSEATARSRKAKAIAKAWTQSDLDPTWLAQFVADARLNGKPCGDPPCVNARAVLGRTLLLASQLSTIPCSDCGGGYYPDCARCGSTGELPNRQRRDHPWVEASPATWAEAVEILTDMPAEVAP